MQLVVVHQQREVKSGHVIDGGLLRFGISNEPVSNLVLQALNKRPALNGNGRVKVAVPQSWIGLSLAGSLQIDRYGKEVRLFGGGPRPTTPGSWFVISNGQFVTQIGRELLEKLLVKIETDVLMLEVRPELRGYCEKVRLTTDSRIAGFRRLYSDTAEPAALPIDWPAHIFVKNDVLERLLPGGILPQSFSEFLKKCRSAGLRLQAIGIGGAVWDLATGKGLLDFAANRLAYSEKQRPIGRIARGRRPAGNEGTKISAHARIVGNVLFGRDVSIEADAVVVGPTIICNNVVIGKGAVVRASIIGPGVSVTSGRLIQRRVVVSSRDRRESSARPGRHRAAPENGRGPVLADYGSKGFRTWPRFSYPRFFKRLADIFAAAAVLILFAPVFPIIALAVSLTSRGGVFFRDLRQGRHARQFRCLKFRTMLVGADKMQRRLRALNQADGPQFKMADDPRLSPVGKFLRDTYIDEIPQFFNVLLGQMSVVGPRPSPEQENTLCPQWRDARLSVRPGITGLWQVCRTRKPGKDFQEWIHYDTTYVRDLSLRMDLWICWQTARQVVRNFAKQF